MGYIHGKNTIITVDGDVVKATDSTTTRTRKSHPVSGYGDNGTPKEPGQTDDKFGMSGFYDSTASTGSRSILQPLHDSGAKVVVTRKPEGTGSGKPLETFTVIITSYVETSPSTDMTKWQCDTEVDGTIVTTTQGA